MDNTMEKKTLPWFFLFFLGFLTAEGVGAKQALLKPPLAKAKFRPPLPSNLWIEMARISQPGVVGVYLDIDYPQRRRDPLLNQLEELFGNLFQYEDLRKNEESAPIGTGFIVDKQGHIVTNYHVIMAVDNPQFKTQLRVQINGQGQPLEVEVLGHDARGDLALLKIPNPPKNLHPLQFGDSDQLQVGEYVAAFGNPYGHSNSMTVGVVSAKGRTLRQINRFPFIQTDASINPGNSGGPLLNTKGYVIGMNTAIDPRAQGIGFAIPSNYVKKIVSRLKAGQTIQRGFLGIGMATLHPQVMRSYGIKKQGVVVTGVEPGFPAARAGLQANDIIYEFNSQALLGAEDFIHRVQDTPVGTSVELKVLRPLGHGFQKKTFQVTLTSYPEAGSSPSGSPRSQRKLRPQESLKPPKQKDSFLSPSNPLNISKYKGTPDPFKLGFSVVDSSSGARREFNVPVGFPFGPLISQIIPDSPAFSGGFRKGDILLQVNGKAVNSAQDVMDNLRPGLNRFSIHSTEGKKTLALRPR